VQVRVERVVARHLMTLATFLAQPHPQLPVLHVDIINPHRERGTDPRERKHHQRDQRAVAQPRRRAHIDAVEQLPRLARLASTVVFPLRAL